MLQTYLVTGATDGIGRATALALAKTGSRVVLHGRNPDKLSTTVADIAHKSGNDDLHIVQADFASLAEVARLSDEVAEQFPRTTVLINNAGHLTDHRQESVDGFELTFAVNYLAPFLLTLKLLETLKRNVPARIVNVASTALGGGVLDFDNLQMEQGFDGWQAYANSKLMNAMFSHQVAEQLGDTNVVSNALCPGLIDTNFFHTNTLFAGRYDSMRGHMRSAEEGALMPLYLATDTDAGTRSGEFLVREGRNGHRAIALNHDRESAAALWRLSESYVAQWL